MVSDMRPRKACGKRVLAGALFTVLFAVQAVSSGGKILPININIGQKNAYMEATVTREEKGATTVSGVRIWKLGKNYRIEESTDAGPLLMIINGRTLYVVSGAPPNALVFDVMSPEAEVFLKKVFINMGRGRRGLSALDPETIAGKKCSGARYALLKNASGIYCRSELSEWRTEKTMTLLKAIAVTAPCSIGEGKGRIVFDGVRETFAVSKLKSLWFPSRHLLDLPKGCGIEVVRGRE